jgi:hypothetical protein
MPWTVVSCPPFTENGEPITDARPFLEYSQSAIEGKVI